MDAARQELEQIPPPSKNRYLSVRTQDAYRNPFIVVHPQTVTLTILFRDQDPNAFAAGGLLRPAKARKQEVDVRPGDLPQAPSSLSPDVWPYGRVVANEESPTPHEPSASPSAATSRPLSRFLTAWAWWWMNGRDRMVRCYANWVFRRDRLHGSRSQKRDLGHPLV